MGEQDQSHSASHTCNVLNLDCHITPIRSHSKHKIAEFIEPCVTTDIDNCRDCQWNVTRNKTLKKLTCWVFFFSLCLICKTRIYVRVQCWILFNNRVPFHFFSLQGNFSLLSFPVKKKNLFVCCLTEGMYVISSYIYFTFKQTNQVYHVYLQRRWFLLCHI